MLSHKFVFGIHRRSNRVAEEIVLDFKEGLRITPINLQIGNMGLEGPHYQFLPPPTRTIPLLLPAKAVEQKNSSSKKSSLLVTFNLAHILL